ncbi:TIGR04255 family protein [Streptacidiphilus fuscans]|uniref:TIGR04255 family protein n=1 Tax=Streptacidiphilus fuscans TaxID=2789292 RepID=A0A931FHG0_9ACTN|nr:TIGR04255 family protein [Streptacidiphilus fuscans]MBF9073563.1 TIGR04255 family protein [Streptacidiphilus fuscans]
MAPREIYPSAPLALVAAEVRHSTSPPLSEPDKTALKSLLSASFPLWKPAQRMNLGVNASGTSATVTTDPRFMSRDRTSSVTYRDDAIVVETTRYERRSELRALLEMAVAARQKVASIDGVERLGIRFVNEIRVPELESPSEWSRWIAPSLTGPASLKPANGMELQSWQGLAIFGTQTAGVVVRHGAFEGYAVNPVGDLQRVAPPPGPFFLLDMDCFWTPEGETPPLEWGELEARYNEASLSAYDLFEQLITDKLREEVLRYVR